MARIIAITNQKGGVGKTTTAMQLGTGLKLMGRRVLFIDMDSQCSLSYMLGGEVEGVTSILELLTRRARVQDAIQQLEEGDLIPGNVNLSALEQYLTQTGKEYRLKEALAPLQEEYDDIIIDSPPILGLPTINILTASDRVIIPALADILSLQGIGQLYETIDAVRTYCNPGLVVSGVLITRYAGRLKHTKKMNALIEEAANQYGTRVYQSTIREAVSIREAADEKMSIYKYAPKSKQAQDYTAFVQEFCETEGI